MINEQDRIYLKRAVEIASQNVKNSGGGPFGAVIVKDNKIIAEAVNTVTIDNDPTAHAEVNAIRKATKALNDFQLIGCTIYCSCEPCPMCLGAIYWSRFSRIVFAASKKDAAKIGFDDDFIYQELDRKVAERTIPTSQINDPDFLEPFNLWSETESKTEY